MITFLEKSTSRATRQEESRQTASKLRVVGLVCCLALGLSACSKPGPEQEFYDPLETPNRAVHGFNKAVDRALIGPAAGVYGAVIPDPAKTAVVNVASNLTMPNRFVNNVLQLDLENAVVTTVRFAVNTVIGIGGIFDVATARDMPDEDTDFGETLHKWNVGEGAYVELPFFGASTARDTVGLVADIMLLDPLDHVLEPDTDPYRSGVWVLDKLGDRDRFGDAIDETLYNSPDSYVTLRSYYLQSRRFQLNKGLSEVDLEDPYDF
jgi:phospholipid-binding lipoprotein MlaA